MKEQLKKSQYNPAARSASPSQSTASAPMSNSIMLSAMGKAEPSRGDLEARMLARMDAAQANQRPMAEAEADKLSAGIDPSASVEEVKSEMGKRLGADFSGVNIHTDAAAREKADSIGAEAYTSGKNVYFGSEGQNAQTVAHELVHTVQQGEVAGTGVTQSVASGTVQMKGGRIRRKLRGLFSRKHKKVPVGPTQRMVDLNENTNFGDNKVAAGKYDADFADMDDATKLDKLAEMSSYLNNRKAQIADSKGADKMSDYDSDIEASYRSVLQQATASDDFLSMLKDRTHDAAKKYYNHRYDERDRFNKAYEEEYGKYKTGDDVEKANREAHVNIINNIGYSDIGDSFEAYSELLNGARDLMAPGDRANKFKLATDSSRAVEVGEEDEEFIGKLSSARHGLRTDRTHATFGDDARVKAHKANFRKNKVDSFRNRFRRG